MNDVCPVRPPRLLKAESIVETCGSCGAWIERYPSFLGVSDGFFECDRCGSTYINTRAGRPYSQKSKRWSEIVSIFEESYLDIHPADWDTVVTEPPMESLDWNAIEQWFRACNIYRVFITIEAVEVTADADALKGDAE